MNAVTGTLKSLAVHNGHAQWAAETTWLSPQPWCTPLVVLGMAGDDDLLWAVAAGEDAREVVVAGDPRILSEHEAVWRGLGRQLDPMWALVVASGVWPQIAVPGSGAVRLLALAARRILRDSVDEQARLAAERITWLVGRHGVPGQQSVLVATEQLLDQITTGMTAHDDRHLGAVLEWLEPGAGGAPASGDVEGRALLAAMHPAGVLALPGTERSLEAPVERFAQDPDRARTAVAGVLGPVLEHQRRLVDRALALLSSVVPAATPASARVVVAGTDVNALLEQRESRLWRKHFDGDPLVGQPRIIGGVRVQAQDLQDAERVESALRWCRAAVDCYAALSTGVEGLTAYGTVVRHRWMPDGSLHITVQVADRLRVDQSEQWRLADDLGSRWSLIDHVPDNADWLVTLGVHAGSSVHVPGVGQRCLLLPVDPVAEIKRALAPPATGTRMWTGTVLHPRAGRP